MTIIKILKHPLDLCNSICRSVLIGIALIVCGFWVGLFDRPKWEDVVFLQPSRRRLWCILAMTNDQPRSPAEEDKLFDAAKEVLNGLSKDDNNSSSGSSASSASPSKPRNKSWKTSLLLSRAAYHYYGGDSTPSGSISCTVYFEEQGGKTTSRSLAGNKYRCGFGWLVGLENDDSEVKSLLSDLASSPSLSTSSQTKSGNYKCPYPIRIVDLGTGPARKGRVQWRNSYTPWIARLLHWNSEFSSCCGDDVDVVECELTVRPGSAYESKPGSHPGPSDRNPNNSQPPAYIDYLLLNSKTTSVWNPHDFMHQQHKQQTNTSNSTNNNSNTASNHNIFSDLLAAMTNNPTRSKT
eukprot:CAMPEP_0113478852 /NCGR_PEP_ID=MMETSP0014_2-20120614/20981_1 /TAXON_ID=2857 /ORGANISM="Nitzschia sp." /LENGTH=350 /DNA_ID=CAMNT_0000372079 /DNA_START=263 /DNA_END=1315 /DNA_ORIENTATION=+ /assembly_acc=CAM_ASM_000159